MTYEQKRELKLVLQDCLKIKRQVQERIKSVIERIEQINRLYYYSGRYRPGHINLDTERLYNELEQLRMNELQAIIRIYMLLEEANCLIA